MVYEEEEVKPQAVRELFDGDKDLTLKTEVPPQMIIPLLRLKIVMAASDPTRTKPLVQVFIDEYMKLMVSLKRRGRLELLGALSAQMRDEEGEDASF